MEMRGSLTGCLAALAVVVALAPSVAAAETVVAKDSAEVYLRPGESSKVVVRIKSGEELTVLRREGRWVKVRVRGRTGFIPRTKVSGGEDEPSEEVERQTRRRPYVDGRSTDRGWGGEPPEDRRGVDAVDNIDPSEPSPPNPEPKVRVAAVEPSPRREVREPKEKAEAKEKGEPKPDGKDGKNGKAGKKEVVVQIEEAPRSEPRAEPRRPVARRDRAERKRRLITLESEVELRAKPGAAAKKVATAGAGEHFVLEERNGWSKLETEDGEQGWVSNQALRATVEDKGGRRLLAVNAQLGFSYLVQGTRTTGGIVGAPDNYNLVTPGATITVGGLAAFPVSRSLYAGLSASYSGTKAKDIEFNDKVNSRITKTGITTHALDVRAVGGYMLGGSLGLSAWARLGYHYDMFSVADVGDFTKNGARIPSERLSGGTAGAAFSMDRLTRKLGASVAVDALVFSTRSQTKNLEDGNAPSTSGLWVSAGSVYRLGRSMNLELSYKLAYLNNTFGAPTEQSLRMHTGTAVSRTDVSHLIGLGVHQAF